MKYVYIVITKSYVKTDLEIEVTPSSHYSDFMVFEKEEDALQYVRMNIIDWGYFSKIEFEELEEVEVFGDENESWREWRQTDFDKAGVKMGFVIHKKRVR